MIGHELSGNHLFYVRIGMKSRTPGRAFVFLIGRAISGSLEPRGRLKQNTIIEIGYD